MAMYDFGGGSNSHLSNFTEFHMTGGTAGEKNSSVGTAKGSDNSDGPEEMTPQCANAGSTAASGSGLSAGTILFILFCLIGLYLQIRYY